MGELYSSRSVGLTGAAAERFDAGGQGGVLGAAEIGVLRQELLGGAAGPLDQAGVVEGRDAELREAALADAEVVAGAALAEVVLGQLEATLRLGHDPEALHLGLAALL